MRAWSIAFAALLLDCLLGDPAYPFHPARLAGGMAAFLEPRLRRLLGSSVLAGAVGWLFVVVPAAAAGILIPKAVGWLLGTLGTGIGLDSPAIQAWTVPVVQVLLVYTAIAPRDMATHALRVAKALKPKTVLGAARENLSAGRKAVSMIVGRDVERLDGAGVVRAAVESVAESTVDGVIAPLFWALVAGAPGALAYRAANTLDSLWGHKDERYLAFGRVAARADDLAAWLPARLSFLCGLAALLPLGLVAPRRFDPASAAKLGWRDRRKHESPNAAWMEALEAGALGLRLGGPASYGGLRLEKPFLGEDRRPPEVADIGRSVVLMYGSTLVFMALSLLCLSLLAP